MALLVRKLFWFLIFMGVFICTARIDYYFGISEQYRNSQLMDVLVKMSGVFPDGESIMNFHDWVMIHIIILVALIPFSVIRVLIQSYIEGIKSITEIIIRAFWYYIKATSITLFLMVLVNFALEI